jgi:hypothetical protein
MYRRTLILLAVAAALFFLPALLADVITLKGGSRIEGEIVEETEESIAILLSDGSRFVFPKADLENIERDYADDESGLIIDDLLVTPPPEVTRGPIVISRPRVDPSATGTPEATTPSTPQPGEKPAGYKGGWSLESLLPENIQKSGAASAVVFGGLIVLIPLLALGLWAMAYVVKIEEPTLLKSLSSVLAALAIFIAAYLAFRGLNPQAELDSYLILFVVTLLLAVIVAMAIFRTNFLQAFLLWVLPVAIVAGISFLIRTLTI